MLKPIKKGINSGLRMLGYRIQKYTRTDEFTMDAALSRCIKRGLLVNTVIDIGASDGRWSKMCMSLIKDANYLLIEAQEGHKNKLEQFKTENNNAEFIIAAAGKKEGFIYFNNDDLFSGSASETPFEKDCIQVPVISIDNEVKKRNLKSPFILKLDTHGFEVPILEGALETLKKAELVIIETYNFKLTNTSLKYYEICGFMEKLGFSSIEMADFMLRIHDKSFWQMDIFFIPNNRQEFDYRSYK
jgi:FkbM family methyltransferase